MLNKFHFYVHDQSNSLYFHSIKQRTIPDYKYIEHLILYQTTQNYESILKKNKMLLPEHKIYLLIL
jgi:hypothetical protein